LCVRLLFVLFDCMHSMSCVIIPLDVLPHLHRGGRMVVVCLGFCLQWLSCVMIPLDVRPQLQGVGGWCHSAVVEAFMMMYGVSSIGFVLDFRWMDFWLRSLVVYPLFSFWGRLC
jgi:hypothetical protein